MDIDIRPITQDEMDPWRAALIRGFGSDPQDIEGLDERFRATLPFERTLGAFDGSQVVGTFGSFALDLTVPGGDPVSTGGTTMVTVQATHRRRGILSQMMRRHLSDTREWGEPLAALWASEAAIYRRYGFGLASDAFRFDIDITGEAVVPGDSPGSLRLVEPDEARNLVPQVFSVERERRPGTFVRTDDWWEHRRFFDPPEWRDGRSSYRWVVYEDAGTVRGYVQYRQKDDWTDGRPQGSVHVVELMAAEPEAEQALWRYVTSIDLMAKVSAWNRPVDDPLRWWMPDHRRIKTTLMDGLWVRVLDVPAAVEARRYRRDGSITVQIHDEFLGWTDGTHRIEIDAGRATCKHSAAEPDVRMPVSALGAMLLGGRSAGMLRRAGRIDGTPEAAMQADRLFMWPVAPWCPEVF